MPERALLFKSLRKKGQETPRLGFRSGFVLAKLGFDLREQYKDVLNEPLSDEIERSLERLRGPGGGVTRLDDHKPR